MSFAEQLAARAAKRTSSSRDVGADAPLISSPARGISGGGDGSSSSLGSSPSRKTGSLTEQIKSRATDRSNSDRSAAAVSSPNIEGITQRKQKSSVDNESARMSTSSSRSKERSENNASTSVAKVASVSPQQQKRRVENELDNLFDGNSDNDDGDNLSTPTAAATTQKQPDNAANRPNPNKSTTATIDHHQSITSMAESPSSSTLTNNDQSSSSLSKLKIKLDKYKSDNKKLRHETLLLKAKLEEMATIVTKLQQLESNHKSDNEDLLKQVEILTDKITQLEKSETSLKTKLLETEKKKKKKSNNIEEGKDEEEKEWNGIRSSLIMLRKRRASISDNSGSKNSGGKESMISLDTAALFADMEKEELVAENVRLTQLMLDMEGLEELEKFANSRKWRKGGEGSSSDDGGSWSNDIYGAAGAANDEKDAIILELNQKLSMAEGELVEVTELKNAEIDLLRKQLNRVEQQQQQQHHHHYRKNSKEDDPQDANVEGQWKKEREELREEIRRLNFEVSLQMSNRLDQEEEDDNARYSGNSNSTSPNNMDDSDVASLQSIIGMMRQTIDQSNKEKEELEQRLAEEQERSQMELKAFAKTLEGVDDLRKSAETMSREIRRIKVKGYRPTRSDLMGVSGFGDLDGVRNFGELTAAVAASESMEDAIRLIEGQNDAMEERRRMGVVAASHGSATYTAAPAALTRKGSSGLRAISEDEDDDEYKGGGFLSFWNSVGRSSSKDEDDDIKRERKKKSKRKKKRDEEGSVFTSFF